MVCYLFEQKQMGNLPSGTFLFIESWKTFSQGQQNSKLFEPFEISIYLYLVQKIKICSNQSFAISFRTATINLIDFHTHMAATTSSAPN